MALFGHFVLVLSFCLCTAGPSRTAVWGTAEGTFHLKEPSEVKVAVGDDVILPCHRQPPDDAMTYLVEWSFNKPSTYVHVYRDGKDHPELQDESFTGRTSLFHHEMKKGNVSLKLTKVTGRDAGNYTCNFKEGQDKEVNITLVVLVVEPEEKSSSSIEGDRESPVPSRSVKSVLAPGFLGVLLCAGFILWGEKKDWRARRKLMTAGPSGPESIQQVRDMEEGQEVERPI